MSRPWAIVGNPENRRVEFFQRALASRGLAPATVLSYESLLRGDSSIRSLPEDAIVRVDSPGENWAVEHRLITAGEQPALAEGSCIYSGNNLVTLPDEHGRILAPHQWYFGYISSIRSWSKQGESSGQLWTATPRELETQFDKALCQARCQDANVPTPRSLGVVSSWDDLESRMESVGINRVFVKLANSSSASGVMAIERKGEKVVAITSLEFEECGEDLVLFNSLKIRRYTDRAEVARLVDELAKHRAIAEQWLPKASMDRRVCDLRILVIAGEPRHTVVRTSRSPLTNLHLGNRRGDIDQFWQHVSEEQQQELRETCRRCAAIFPGSLHLGIDILFTPGWKKHFVLEINAFGDLLPGVTHQGANTYEAQVDAVLAGWTGR